MDKKPLIVVSICAVVLLVLGSLSNVVGYQTVQSSNQNTINNEVNQKELLFQTIVDIANNKEIQKIILNSEMRRGGFFNADTRFLVFTSHMLTMKELNTAYHIGLLLTKTLSASKIHSLLERYWISNQGVQKEIIAVIEKDAIINGEMKQLSNSKCDCENENTTSWSFPVICTILLPLFILTILCVFALQKVTAFLDFCIVTISNIALLLNCSWFPPS
jgi:hypothetical protein